MDAIRLPGGMALGMGSGVAQDDELYGGSTRLRAQATVMVSAVGIAMGYAAIASGGALFVVMSGALTIAAAPVAATLSLVYLAQAGTPRQTDAYRKVMDIVGVTASVGGLIGFTTYAVFTRDYKGALEVSKGAGLAERILSVEKVAGLAGGYEVGALAVDGANLVAKQLEKVAPLSVPKPEAQPPNARPTPSRGRDQNGDRETEGQRRAERAQEARERQQERQREQAERASRDRQQREAERAQGKNQEASKPSKPGKGDVDVSGIRGAYRT